MGCDIHQRMFLYDRNVKSYIDSDVMRNIFDDVRLVGTRDYDFFGIMGNNSRSMAYKPMKCLKSGVPDFFSELCKDDYDNPDWYGFSHCTINSLKSGFSSYITKLKKHIDSGKKYNNVFYCEPKYMIEYLEGRIKTIDTILETMEKSEFKIMCDINNIDIDMKKTMFVFWFDN